METVKCRSCRKYKPAATFTQDIYKGRCDLCHSNFIDSIARRRERDRRKAKRYYQEHKEELAEMKKEYRTVYNKIDVECEVCKCTVRKYIWSKHILTQKHIDNLESKIETLTR